MLKKERERCGHRLPCRIRTAGLVASFTSSLGSGKCFTMEVNCELSSVILQTRMGQTQDKDLGRDLKEDEGNSGDETEQKPQGGEMAAAGVTWDDGELGDVRVCSLAGGGRGGARGRDTSQCLGWDMHGAAPKGGKATADGENSSDSEAESDSKEHSEDFIKDDFVILGGGETKPPPNRKDKKRGSREEGMNFVGNEGGGWVTDPEMEKDRDPRTLGEGQGMAACSALAVPADKSWREENALNRGKARANGGTPVCPAKDNPEPLHHPLRQSRSQGGALGGEKGHTGDHKLCADKYPPLPAESQGFGVTAWSEETDKPPLQMEPADVTTNPSDLKFSHEKEKHICGQRDGEYSDTAGVLPIIPDPKIVEITKTFYIFSPEVKHKDCPSKSNIKGATPKLELGKKDVDEQGEEKLTAGKWPVMNAEKTNQPEETNLSLREDNGMDTLNLISAGGSSHKLSTSTKQRDNKSEETGDLLVDKKCPAATNYLPVREKAKQSKKKDPMSLDAIKSRVKQEGTLFEEIPSLEGDPAPSDTKKTPAILLDPRVPLHDDPHLQGVEMEHRARPRAAGENAKTSSQLSQNHASSNSALQKRAKSSTSKPWPVQEEDELSQMTSSGEKEKLEQPCQRGDEKIRDDDTVSIAVQRQINTEGTKGTVTSPEAHSLGSTDGCSVVALDELQATRKPAVMAEERPGSKGKQGQAKHLPHKDVQKDHQTKMTNKAESTRLSRTAQGSHANEAEVPGKASAPSAPKPYKLASSGSPVSTAKECEAKNTAQGPTWQEEHHHLSVVLPPLPGVPSFPKACELETLSEVANIEDTCAELPAEDAEQTDVASAMPGLKTATAPSATGIMSGNLKKQPEGGDAVPEIHLARRKHSSAAVTEPVTCQLSFLSGLEKDSKQPALRGPLCGDEKSGIPLVSQPPKMETVSQIEPNQSCVGSSHLPENKMDSHVASLKELDGVKPMTAVFGYDPCSDEETANLKETEREEAEQTSTPVVEDVRASQSNEGSAMLSANSMAVSLSTTAPSRPLSAGPPEPQSHENKRKTAQVTTREESAYNTAVTTRTSKIFLEGNETRMADIELRSEVIWEKGSMEEGDKTSSIPNLPESEDANSAVPTTGNGTARLSDGSNPNSESYVDINTEDAKATADGLLSRTNVHKDDMQRGQTGPLQRDERHKDGISGSEIHSEAETDMAGVFSSGVPFDRVSLKKRAKAKGPPPPVPKKPKMPHGDMQALEAQRVRRRGLHSHSEKDAESTMKPYEIESPEELMEVSHLRWRDLVLMGGAGEHSEYSVTIPSDHFNPDVESPASSQIGFKEYEDIKNGPQVTWENEPDYLASAARLPESTEVRRSRYRTRADVAGADYCRGATHMDLVSILCEAELANVAHFGPETYSEKRQRTRYDESHADFGSHSNVEERGLRTTFDRGNQMMGHPQETDIPPDVDLMGHDITFLGDLGYLPERREKGPPPPVPKKPKLRLPLSEVDRYLALLLADSEADPQSMDLHSSEPDLELQDTGTEMEQVSRPDPRSPSPARTEPSSLATPKTHAPRDVSGLLKETIQIQEKSKSWMRLEEARKSKQTVKVEQMKSTFDPPKKSAEKIPETASTPKKGKMFCLTSAHVCHWGYFMGLYPPLK